MPWHREIDGVSTVYPSHPRRREEKSELPQVTAALEDGLDPNELWVEEDLIIQQPKGGCVLPHYDFGHDTWPHHNSPLHRAVHIGDVESARLLLKSGADVDLYNSFGSTPLYEAVARKKHDMMRLLLAHGANVNRATVERRVEYEDAEMEIDGVGDDVAVIKALENRDEQALSILASAGADLSPSAVQPWTVLDLAVIAKNRACVQVLLQHGAKLSKDKPVGTPGKTKETLLDESRKLLASIIGPKYIPDNSVYDAFCHVAGASRGLDAAFHHAHIDGDEVDEGQTAAHTLLHSFYETLMKETGIQDLRQSRTKHMCHACHEFQRGAASIFDSNSQFKFKLHESRQQLNDSASEGCPLCSVIADLLDRKESRPQENVHGDEAPAHVTSPAVSLTLDLDEPGSPDLLSAELSVVCGEIQARKSISFKEDLSFPTIGDNAKHDTDTGSTSATQTVKTWLDESKGSEHEYCTANAAAKEMAAQDGPRRLIRVGTESELPRLIDCQGSQLRYCALSYDRGNQETCITTRANKSQHELGIAIEALPALFRDAIHAARELGYEYIWIHALCVVGDDEEDRADAIDRVSSIYYLADLTISSLLSGSSDKGLFTPRKNRVVRHIPLNIWGPSSYLDPGWSPAIHAVWKKRVLAVEGPLHSQGLALQEQLSSSKLLWFGDGILHWECLDGYKTEAEPARNHVPDDYQARQRLDQRIKRRRDMNFDILDCTSDKSKAKSNKTLIEHWKALVQDFTKLYNGSPTGRLQGISSLSKVLAHASGNKFTHGIWEGDMLLQSLCWMLMDPKTNSNASTAGVPSWSWGSVAGEVSFKLVERGGRGDKDIIPGSTVQVADARLQVTTRLCKKGPFQTSWLDETSFETLLLEHSCEVDKPVFFDKEFDTLADCYTMDVLQFPQGPVYQGYGLPRWPNGRPSQHIKLLLQPVDREANVFRRVGIAVGPGSFTAINPDDIEEEDDDKDSSEGDGKAEEEMTPLLWTYKDEEVWTDTEIVLI